MHDLNYFMHHLNYSMHDLNHSLQHLNSSMHDFHSAPVCKSVNNILFIKKKQIILIRKYYFVLEIIHLSSAHWLINLANHCLSSACLFALHIINRTIFIIFVYKLTFPQIADCNEIYVFSKRNIISLFDSNK